MCLAKVRRIEVRAGSLSPRPGLPAILGRVPRTTPERGGAHARLVILETGQLPFCILPLPRRSRRFLSSSFSPWRRPWPDFRWPPAPELASRRGGRKTPLSPARQDFAVFRLGASRCHPFQPHTRVSPWFSVIIAGAQRDVAAGRDLG